ncbi:protein TPR2-like [Asparagus officinalis]|uniref:protein TPR2-like n=1 Tax=Asparagus officinalis TaxID=4686 RepID=UPI00098E6F4D|nr:protein TPR2-like [Asparagus officinalis]
MSSLSRELVFLILQFLDEEKFKETVHKLEQESGFYFNMKHFEDQVQAGEWDEVEKYLGGFTKVEDNRYSMKIFFEIRKQKYLEALDSHDRAKAVEILVKDLKVFASFNEELFKEITQLLTLENFRQNEQLSKYGDTKSARNIMLLELKKLIEANPLFRDKLTFPGFKASRLRTLINQSLNWQHQLCKNPRPNPDIKTLFTDHTCAPTNGARPPPPTNGPLVGPIPKSGPFPPLGAHSPFQPVVSPSASAIAGWMTSGNPSMPHAAVAQGPPGLVQPPNTAAFLKHPRTPTSATGMDYQTADSEHLMKRMRTGQSDEVSFSGASHPSNVYSQDDLPKSVVRTLNQGSNVMSLDFHPQHQTFLLVGTNVGDIGIWEVGSRERIAHKNFKVWDVQNCSVPLQAALMKDATISVNRCLWSPDGSVIGVAFSKHLIQTYAYIPNGELRQQLEIDAHVGGVNDIAFSHPNKSLSIITCGDDKTIKVWDATTGQKQYLFEGHEAPVYSVCPHHKEMIQFIFSTAVDGKIKAWLYDYAGSRVDYDAPGLWCTTMSYSADGSRLFSCGTSKDGDSHLVEWNETEGAIKRTYSGFRKRSLGVVQFDTTRNRFLAAGDEFVIKFWDMDNTNLLTTTDAEGGLTASPRLRFNKEGSLLAVTTNDNGIKILANADGQRLLRMLESRTFEGSRGPQQISSKLDICVSPSASAIAGWMTSGNPSMPHAAVAQGPPGLVQPPNTAAFLKHPRTPTSATGMDYQTADSEHLMKRMRTGQSDEVSFSGASHQSNVYSQDDLPKSVVRTLNQGSNVMSLDFHPQHQTFLLVGTNVGDIGIWEVGSRERIAHKNFKVWDVQNCSVPLQAALMKDATISVNRCLWSPDGSVIGVAFSKHLIQTYAYIPNGELRQQLEIDAHVGGVNDIAFSHPNKSLSIITCGDDKTIKVWDATTGQKQYLFEGHEAPVYSVCPHHKEMIQFIFSTAVDGKIKAWLYDYAGSRVDYDAPGLWCTTMSYSADGSRLFSCGTSKDGDSHLVEWNETEGAIKRTYSGFRKRSLGVVQFDTTRNRFLAAGDEFVIKFWDMDNTNLLTTTDAEGGLTASPRLRFNKEGSLLAVTTNDNGIKILANADGQRLLRMLESRTFEGSRGPQQISSKIQAVSSMHYFAYYDEEVTTWSLIWKLADIVDSAHLKALRLPDTMTAPNKVVRLLYTNSGLAVLALASNAIHKLWKWQRSERNPLGKSTATVVPQLWQPTNGILMTNDTNDSNPEEATACIALSKNDSYVMSASGGKVSLFNMMTFKVMTTFMPPPPAATFLAFHPQDNNIIAIGMEDSSIQIYNVRIDEVKTKLKGHQKKITGLAFSQSLNVLVSSGADAQLCVWSIDGWEKRKSKFIQSPAGRATPLVGDTRVQFHNDQTHILVVHESQISIYDSKLDCSRTWSPRDSLSAPISSAIYSCDGMLVYAGFCDGAVGVFDADSLRLRCRIAPSAYISPPTSSGGAVYPMVIAAHPSESNQVALGMSDGTVYVVEPSDAELKWGAPPPQENGGGALPSISSNPSVSSQASEPPTR